MFTRSIALRLTRTSSCPKAAPRVAYQPSHQRRPSSSKASVPPNGASRGRSSAPSAQEGSSGRSRGKKAKLFAADRDFANLPAVPPTHHLGLENISVSSFFSLHRPISVTTCVPPESTNDSFASIFESRAASRRSQLPKMVQPMNGDELPYDREDMFSAAPAEDAGPQANNQGDEKYIYSRASVPKDVSINQQFAEDLQPFSPPPPPKPLHRRAMLRAMRHHPARPSAGPARRRAMARLFIEIIIPSDELEFLRSSRAVGFLMPQAGGVGGEHAVEQLDPVRRREILQALSVKRQRKLKMKKHKYKKLMKRTRNLRRRLGRL